MSNEKFKVKFGLAVGDTQATIDGTTGDIVTAGDVAVNGGYLTTTQTTANLFNATATTVNIGNGATTEVNLGNTGTGQVQIKSPVIIGANTTQTVFNTVATTVNAFGAATTISIGANTGTTTVNNDLVADSFSGAGGTFGNVTVGVDTDNTISTTFDNLVLQTSTGTNAGTLTLVAGSFTSTGSSISGTTLSIGTLTSGTVYVGQAISGGTTLPGTIITAKITSVTWTVNQTQTVASSAINGAGNIALAPTSIGNVTTTFNNGGNLVNNRNYVFGAIRNATTQSNGDIWVLDADAGGAGTLPVRGISLDNSTDYSTKNAGVVVRNYSNTAGFSPRMVFERSRYTGTPATPLTLSSGDTIGTISGTGYSSTLGWINDTLPFAPAVINLNTAEAWVSNTNLGTTLVALMAPTATTITAATGLIPVITANPQTTASRSDAFTWANGKTGTTQTMALDVSGNLIVTGDVRINGNQIKASNGNTNITLTSNTLTTFAGNIKVTGNAIQNSGGTNAITMSNANATTTVRGDIFNVNNAADTNFLKLSDESGKITLTLTQSRATAANTFATFTFKTYRSTDGINYTPTLNGDDIGQFKFNGNVNTSTTPGSPDIAGSITCYAAENWTPTAIGTKFTWSTTLIGATTPFALIDGSSNLLELKSTQTRILDVNANPVLTVNATNATFAQPVGFPVKTAAQWNAITGAVGQQVCVSNSGGGGNPNGMMAFWDTTNSRWSYIHDNSAV